MSKRIYYVDIPDPDNWDGPDPSWVNIAVFDSQDEALAFCKEAFGADDDGQINLISVGETYEEEMETCEQ